MVPITYQLQPIQIASPLPVPTVQLPAWPPPALPIELVWHSTFNTLFGGLPHRWSLSPVLDGPVGNPLWSVHTDAAKVRFLCEECGNGWTSMKGRVVFWYALVPNEYYCEGHVLFKLFGQKCLRCNGEQFQHAMWYPEEVRKVVWNVYIRVSQDIYQLQTPEPRRDRRGGRPRKQHDGNGCEACCAGLCSAMDKLQLSSTHSPAEHSPSLPARSVTH